MPAGRYSSRTFGWGRAIYTALQGVSFTPHPNSNEVPEVYFGHEKPDAHSEVIVVGMDPDHQGTEWARLSPPGRDEYVVFKVYGWSHTPGMKTPDDIWDRLAVLSEQIESIAFDTVNEGVTTLGVDGEIFALVQSVTPQVSPTDEGWIGSVVVEFRCFANI